MTCDRRAITYYVWLRSDWSYFGGERFEALAQRYDLKVDYRPVRLYDVYDATHGRRLKDRGPERQAYRVAELRRWQARLGLPFNFQPRFDTVSEDLASGMVIAGQRAGLAVGGLCNSFLRAMWAEDRDISDRATAVAIAETAGLPGARLAELALTADIRAELAGNTARAKADAAFGAPFWIYCGDPFWGQDRLDFLEDAVSASIGRAA